MKLVSFSVRTDVGAVTRLGSLHDGTVVNLTSAHTLATDRGASDRNSQDILPTEMLAFLERGEAAMRTAENVSEFALDTERTNAPDGARLTYPREEVTLLSPLPRPHSLRDCSVYEGHLLNTRNLEPGELPDAYYDYPVYYNGNPDAVVAPDTEVAWPAGETRLDYELEIAAVIGQRGRDIPAADAAEYIAGFTIFNDFSARDHQLDTKPVGLGPGKSKDFVSGLGPCLVTADAIDPTALSATTRVNGEVWAKGSTNGMYHSWDDVIEYVSAGMELYPGDIIGSGTIEGGCGLGQDRWLEPGDTIELDVESIGTLRHTVVEGGTGVDR